VLSAFTIATPLRARRPADRPSLPSSKSLGNGQSPHRSSKLVLPAKFRSFGLHFALLCAALAGIVPFLGMGIVALLDALSDRSSALQVPTHFQMSPPSFPVDPSSDGVVAQLSGAIDSLSRAMQQQEAAQRQSQADTTVKLRRLEDGLSEARSTASYVAEHLAASTGKVAALDADADASDLLGLGVDWAAWTAGAEIDHSATSRGLGREPSAAGFAARTARVVAAAFPRYRSFVGKLSPPPEVVLAADSAPPSRCFIFEGQGVLTVRLAQPHSLNHIVLERMASWAMLHPQSTPRHFQVHVQNESSSETLQSIPADSPFEYVLAGPRVRHFPCRLR